MAHEPLNYLRPPSDPDIADDGDGELRIRVAPESTIAAVASFTAAATAVVFIPATWAMLLSRQWETAGVLAFLLIASSVHVWYLAAHFRLPRIILADKDEIRMGYDVPGHGLQVIRCLAIQRIYATADFPLFWRWRVRVRHRGFMPLTANYKTLVSDLNGHDAWRYVWVLRRKTGMG